MPLWNLQVPNIGPNRPKSGKITQIHQIIDFTHNLSESKMSKIIEIIEISQYLKSPKYPKIS